MTDQVEAGRPFESRAAIAFGLGAAVTSVALLTLLSGLWNPDSSRALAISTTAWALLAIVVDAVLAVGLELRRPWAVAAAGPALVVALVVGLVGAIAKLAQGSLPIPIDLIILVWALTGPRAVTPVPPLRKGAVALVAASLLWAVVGASLAPVFGPGGALDAPARDLDSSISADCGPAQGGTPATIDVAYRWSWRRSPFLSSGADIVVIKWFGGGGSESQPYILEGTPETAAGIAPGGMSGDGQAGAQAFSSGQAWPWAIDPTIQGYRPGEIHVTLGRSSLHSTPGVQLEILAKYFHAGAWASELVQASCAW